MSNSSESLSFFLLFLFFPFLFHSTSPPSLPPSLSPSLPPSLSLSLNQPPEKVVEKEAKPKPKLVPLKSFVDLGDEDVYVDWEGLGVGSIAADGAAEETDGGGLTERQLKSIQVGGIDHVTYM